MKKILFPFFLVLLIFLASCDSNNSGGTVVAPGDTDAYIIDAALCTGITNNFPSGITNNFYTGDKVNLWIHWANVTKGQRVTVEWWTPGNSKTSEYTSQFQSTASKQISIHYLDLGSFASTGEWVAKVYLDDKFIRSYLFIVGS